MTKKSLWVAATAALLVLGAGSAALAADAPAMAPKAGHHMMMDPKTMMDRFDKFAGADHLMDKSEFTAMLKGTPMEKRTDKMWAELLKKYDKDKDGKISRDEMQQHVNDMASHMGKKGMGMGKGKGMSKPAPSPANQ